MFRFQRRNSSYFVDIDHLISLGIAVHSAAALRPPLTHDKLNTRRDHDEILAYSVTGVCYFIKVSREFNGTMKRWQRVLAAPLR